MEDNDGLEFLLALYAELLPQLARPYANEPQKLRMIRWKIARLKNKLVSLSLLLSLSQRMDSADLFIYDIKMLLDILKHCSV